MVAVLTAALMTAAEISSLFCALGVIVCFVCMVVFILRVNGEDVFGTSVVHVAQPPAAQVSFQKVVVPFTLELHKSSEATVHDVQLRVRSDVSYVFRSYWGVISEQLHSAMSSPWASFKVNLMDNPDLNAEVVDEAERFDASESFECKGVGLSQDTSPLSLGPSPRKKYPLVICMVRQDSDEDVDPSTVGALISIIHIKDSECQVPTCILHQYLKQYSGQLTRLQALYTQGNSRNGESPVRENTSVDKDTTDTKADDTSDDDSDIPIEEACVVCQTNRITRALLPCRHVCVCSRCFERLETCPMCRAKFLAYFLVAPESEEPIDESEELQLEDVSLWQRMYNAINNFIVPEH